MKKEAYNLRRGIDDAQRLREIVSVLFEAGFERQLQDINLCRLVPLPRRLVCGLRAAQAGPAVSVEVRFRKACEQLGPTFVKFGQMLALRPDVVGEDAAAEFAKLQERAAPVPYADVLAALEEQLGGGVKTFFRSVSPRPIASASMAQVHRAVTHDGKHIVLKVQRPGIRAEVTRDLHLLALLARLLERALPAARNYQPVDIVRTFSEWTLRELDFTVEAGHVERFRADFAEEPRMHVPAVHWDYTRPGLLALDEVSGIRLGQLKRLRSTKVNRKETAAFVMEAFLHQFFVTGFFHGDPHPGNLLVAPGGGIVLYDFGIMGYLPSALRYELVSAFQAYLRRDMEAFVKHVLDMSTLAPEADVVGFSAEVRKHVDAVVYRPSSHKGLPHAYYKIIVSGGRHGVRFPTDLVLFAKALLTIETVLQKLDPKINLDASMAPLFDQLTMARLDPRSWLPETREEALEFVRKLPLIPERTSALLKRMEEGNFSVRLDLDELKVLMEEFDRENDLRILAIVAAAILVASALVLASPGVLPWGSVFGKMGLLAAAVMLLGVFLQARHKPA
ncbi:AarF/ABC1/UbiB kinase family protein [Patescibacteria group bacterium]|nr:MAG: AarF/ABC1/UbiB kinase family protein [Patescibacteria group bacterium]